MLPALLRRWRHRSAPKAAILRYHRVAEVVTDRQGPAVSARRFAEHLAVLRDHFTPVPLERIASDVPAGPFPDRSIAITFDDGYRDVLVTARPLLEQAQIAAVVFVVSGMIGAQSEFWWDTLERIYPAGPPAGLHRLLKSLDEPARTTMIDRLAAEARLDPGPRPDRATLTAADIEARRDDPWLSVGSHTKSHPMLARLSPARQWEEISESKLALDGTLGQAVTAFSYPYGSGTRLGRMVARAGFQCACTTEESLVYPGADPYRLPRIFVGDWTGAELARRLEALGL